MVNVLKESFGGLKEALNIIISIFIRDSDKEAFQAFIIVWRWPLQKHIAPPFNSI